MKLLDVLLVEQGKPRIKWKQPAQPPTQQAPKPKIKGQSATLRPQSSESQTPADTKTDLVKMIQAALQSGKVDKEALASFQAMYQLLGQLVGDVKSGKVDVEKPAHGSWYDKRRKQSEQPTEKDKRSQTFQVWKRRIMELIAANPKMKEYVDRVINNQYREKKGWVGEAFDLTPGGHADTIAKFRDYVRKLDISELEELSKAAAQAIRDPKSVEQPKQTLGPSRTGAARALRKRKLQGKETRPHHYNQPERMPNAPTPQKPRFKEFRFDRRFHTS